MLQKIETPINGLNWRATIERMKQNTNTVKVVAAGVAVIAVFSCLLLIVGYHDNQMAQVQAKLRSSENQWKRMASQLETRTKRNAIKMDKWMGDKQGHQISKRAADGVRLRPTLVGGAVFTRWGRSDCPDGSPSRMIYNGIAAAALHSATGGGAKYLCIHTNITYQENHYKDANQGASYIYGVEYRDAIWVNELFDLQDIMGKNMLYNNVPCAQCIAGPRQGEIMIPGQYKCPKDWTYEYDGYIMAAGHSNGHSTDYICVDKRPQVVPGTQATQASSSYLYIVETQCTSLLCEPVVLGREIRCVVCTV